MIFLTFIPASMLPRRVSGLREDFRPFGEEFRKGIQSIQGRVEGFQGKLQSMLSHQKGGRGSPTPNQQNQPAALPKKYFTHPQTVLVLPQNAMFLLPLCFSPNTFSAVQEDEVGGCV